MVAAASVVVAVGTATGLLSALDGGGGAADEARPEVTGSPLLAPLPAVSPTPPTPSASKSPSPSARTTEARKPSRTPSPSSSTTGPERVAKQAPGPGSARLYRYPDSQVLDWVGAHRDDPRRSVIETEIADRPAAVWFADFSPSTITARVRAVTAGAAGAGRVPVLVPYAVPDRDCGGASQGGAPDLDAYDGWIDAFAGGLGSGEVIVILEPDSIAQADCLSPARRADRFASLARAGRVLKAADPDVRVYYDAGHSGWNSPAEQAALLRQAGAASAASSDGVFSNVSNFHRTDDEIAYDRRVLDALGGPAGLGAVIDTSRNGNGAPADGEWCDPAGRKLGRAPTTNTGEARIDAYLWVKLPGESDGCMGTPGTFTASYAYDLAR
ncbi:glycoside hydrolase family 6 protein [Streptomyces sp. WI04-05B]|uniref:glycoside hydrolase family 6 protein n=1 Tax=Streptomyces TaxID=1883 RepID=UPI0029ADBB72|nr:MULTISPECIES: glycoside hydrolase family 6 protein [unclassified Streptomyces]MDX2540696.1 glycoside hydrolase family 6 protein [Streptomyces sp. WI04-05B]MDX2585813.1 glycoside hydrolase family 6 protein [Streptomyces sp. WI04-05A]MDX3746153.1 glycoside hydrolase family 6 protein [Streptomyces sp. AK08-02]